MDYTNRIKKIVLRHIDSEKFEVFLFGSRVRGYSKKWSDFDIGVESKNGGMLPSIVRAKIEIDLEKEKVPFKVDLVDFGLVSDDFSKFSKNKMIKWN